MDIHNYEEKLETTKKHFNNSEFISKRNKQLVNGFLNEYGKLHINKPATYDKYYNLFIRLFKHFISKDLDKITKQDIFEFIDKISQSKYTEKGRQDSVKILKTFYLKWYIKSHKVNPKLREMLDFFQEYNYTPDKNKESEPDVLTEKEFEKMLKACNSARDKALMMLLWETGARVGEVLSMLVKHVEEEWKYGKKAIIPESKTKKRTLPVLKSVPYLTEYLNTHPQRDNKGALLWITVDGEPLSYDATRKLLRVAGKRAGIKKRIYPHIFRHSRATDCASKGWTEFKMRKWFGWSMKSDTPALYVRRSGIDLESVVEMENGIEKSDEKKVEEEKLKPKVCLICRTQNPATNIECSNCYRPLEAKKLQEHELQIEEDYKKRLAKMEDRQDRMMKQFETIADNLSP